MTDQVTTVGQVEVPPAAPKPAKPEVIPPQPKPINYNGRVTEVCKSCGIPASGDKPLLVFKQITAKEGGADVVELYAHRTCIGVLMMVHARSLFQIKLTLSGKPT